MTRITATSPAGTAWFKYRVCGSFAFGAGGNQPISLADAVHTAYLALGRKQLDQAVAALRRAGFVVNMQEDQP